MAKAALLSTLMLGTLTACDNTDRNAASPVYVDLGKIISASGIGKQEKAHLDAVKATLMDSAKKAADVYKTLPDENRKKAAVTDAMVLNRDWAAEEQKARIISAKAVLIKVEEYRRAHNIPVILNRTAILAADPKADISDEITKSMTDVSVDYGKLPTLKIKEEDAPTQPTK